MREEELAALRAAIAILDSEEVRYTQRYVDCPNGCAFDYADAVVVHNTQYPLPAGMPPPLVKQSGPEDCTCDGGVVEDESAAHLDPLLAVLRSLAVRLAVRPGMSET